MTKLGAEKRKKLPKFQKSSSAYHLLGGTLVEAEKDFGKKGCTGENDMSIAKAIH